MTIRRFSNYTYGYPRIIWYWGISCCKDYIDYTREELKQRCYDHNLWTHHIYDMIVFYSFKIKSMLPEIENYFKDAEIIFDRADGISIEATKIATEKKNKAILLTDNLELSYNKDKIDKMFEQLGQSLEISFFQEPDCCDYIGREMPIVDLECPPNEDVYIPEPLTERRCPDE